MNRQRTKKVFKIIAILFAFFVLVKIVVFIDNKIELKSHNAPKIEKVFKLDLGNNKYTLDVPEKGKVFLCEINYFKSGASRVGEWIDEAKGVWYPLGKISVQGSVSQEGKSSFGIEGEKIIISTNDLPTTHTTGVFPIAKDDPAYFYDKNPWPIKSQNIVVEVPKNPKIAAIPQCLPWGPLGYSISGVAFEHPLDTQNRDAPAYEIQDSCNGHPQPINGGLYHYHNLPPDSCLGIDEGNQKSVLVGYALDGFGIYKEFKNGKRLTTADLDECHGITSVVPWDGKEEKIYHYVATEDYPYLLGCFRGSVE